MTAMDETDIALCRYLIYNSRMPYSDLAKALDITVQSAHRRVQNLVEQGIIGRFTAAFSPRAYQAAWVMVHGTSEAASIDSVLEELGKDPNMDMAMVASGKYLYISGAVRDPGKIARFSTAVAKTAKISKPSIGIVYNPTLMDHETEPVVYPMDIKIVGMLREDARKPVSDLAESLGVAPRTVTRHIERLTKEMLVHFGYEWFPQKSGDIITALHLTIKKGKEREKVAAALVKRLALREIITYSFADRPDFMITLVWSPNLLDLNNLVSELERDEMYEEVIPNIIIDARYYEGLKAEVPSTLSSSSK
jgi:DNA-binding Lrp family transcriptional regulator